MTSAPTTHELAVVLLPQLLQPPPLARTRAISISRMGKKNWLYTVKRFFLPKKSSPVSDQRLESEEEVKETAADVVSVEQFPAETSPEATNPDAGGGWEEEEDDEEGENLERDRAIAAATKAAAEAADAAARLVRLAGRNRPSREVRAAVVIQAFYRGYLARRALRALRALVRLQALVRGHRVRKQTYTTLRCMQSLIRAQARVRTRRLQLTSHQNLLFSPSSSPAAAAAYYDPYLFRRITEEADTSDEANRLIHTKILKSMRKCSPTYANPCHQRWRLAEHEKPEWLDLWLTARHSTIPSHRLSSNATASSLAEVDGWSEKTVEMDPSTRRSPSHIPGYMAATQSARAKARLQLPAAQEPFLVKCNSCHRRAMSVSAADAGSSGGGKSSAMMNQITWSPGRVGVGLNARRQAGYSPDWSSVGRE